MRAIKYFFTGFVFLLTFLVCFGQEQEKIMFDTTSYSKTWNLIDDLYAVQGLNRSAQKEVEKLYQKIKKGNNPAQIYKCILYKQRLSALVSEEGEKSLIPSLEEELNKSEFPVKALLSAVLADSYIEYLRRNRWVISKRRFVADTMAHYEQWSLKQFNERIIQLLLQSVADKRLKDVDFKQLGEIIKKGSNYGSYEHSLYDILSSESLRNFTNQNLFVQNIESLMDMSNPYFYSIDSNEFKEAIQLMDDKEQYPFWILSLYNEVENYNRTSGYLAALHSIQLQRLRFVHNHFNGTLKEERYLTALTNLQQEAKRDEAYGLISHQLGNLYWHKSNDRILSFDAESKVKEELRKRKSEYIKKARVFWREGAEAFPNTEGSLLCGKMLLSSERKSLSISVENTVLPNKPFLVQVDYKQLESFNLYLYRFSGKEWEEYNSLGRNQQREFLSKRTPFKTKKVELKEYTDFLNHKLEIMHEGLEEGYYIVSLTSLFQNYSQKAEFLVSNMDVTEFKGLKDGWRKIQVLDRTTGESITGASLKLERFNGRYDSQPEEVTYYLTDEKGEFLFQIVDQKKYVLSVSNGNDSIYRVKQWYKYKQNPSPEVEVFETLTFTDRAIYRPGQTVYFKTIVLGEKGKSPAEVKAGIDIKMSLFDTQGDVLHSEWYRTNDFGSVSGHFVLPKDAVNGKFRIFTDLDYGSHYITVEAYKRPTYELSLDKPKGEYTVRDTVEIKGKAMTYAGAPLQDADIRFALYCTYQPFFSWRYLEGGRYIPWSREIFVENGAVQVDDEGNFTLTIDAIKDLPAFLKSNHLLKFRVQVMATDLSGESQEISQDFLLAETGVKIQLAAKENLMEGEDLTAQVSILNSNDNRLEKTVVSSLYLLTKPTKNYLEKYWVNTDSPLISELDYKNIFPDYSFEIQKDKSEWSREKRLWSKKYKAFSADEIIFKTKKYDPGVYIIEVKTKDKNGREVKSSKVFTIHGNEKNDEALVDRIIVQSDKPSYDVGEKANLSVLFPNEKGLYRIMIQFGDTIIWEGTTSGEKVWRKELEIKESYRGNIFIRVHSVYKNRLFKGHKTIWIPWSNKELKVEWISFRDKLKPGENERWELKLNGYKAKDSKVEMVLSLYDASLDSFEKNKWWGYEYPVNWSNFSWSNYGYYKSKTYKYFSIPKLEAKVFRFSKLNLFKLNLYNYLTLIREKGLVQKDNISAITVTREEFAALPVGNAEFSDMDIGEISLTDDQPEKPKVKIRKNFAETAFFYPHIESDNEGRAVVNFTMPDAVTRYKLLGYAHTKDLEQVLFEKELIVQKELMVQLYTPRFLRQGDKLNLRSKVMNISSKSQLVKLKLEFYNGLTEKLVDWTSFEIKEIDIKGNSSVSESWEVKIPEDITYPIKYKVYAIGDEHTDAEQNTLPVLSNRSLIKESLAISLRPNETKEVVFKSLKENTSSTLNHHLYKVESTANPIWYAIQALPYLANLKHESSDRLMTKFFANQLAGKIVSDNSEIAAVFKMWQNSSEGLKSPLQKDEALKEILLSQTPWVLEAQSQAAQLQNLALLFDINRSAEEARITIGKLEKMQLPSGAFPWFSGGRESRYITQNILTSFAHLKSLGIQNNGYDHIVVKALDYLDREMVKDYTRIKAKDELEKYGLPSGLQLYYLYTRSYYSDLDIKDKEVQKVYAYFLDKAESHWTLANLYQKGLIAFSSWKNGHEVSKGIVRSLKESAVQSVEMGMYWNDNIGGYYWDQRQIETQSLMITLFQEVIQDEEAVENMRIWLLQNKRTNHWDNSKSTAWAIYALLLGEGKDALLGNPLEVSIAGKSLESPESLLGLGKTKKMFSSSDVNSSLAHVMFYNPNNHLAFGSVYWQYFEDLDKVKQFKEGPLSLTKKLFVKSESNNEWLLVSSNNPVEVGDQILVRIEFEVDRRLEYVHIKDGRSSGLEPLGLKSGYQWNGGIGHYRSVDDSEVQFFFDRIAKGKHVLEYRLIASHGGNFSNGISRIQCMYAPEFSSHSRGLRLSIQP